MLYEETGGNQVVDRLDQPYDVSVVPTLWTPTSTPTGCPDTPVPIPTVTPTVTPTPTATPECTSLGVTLWMPSDYYISDDPCACTVTVCNPGPDSYVDVPLFVILDVYGSLFFAPTFGDFDFYAIDLDPGEQAIQVLDEFLWPEGTGSASNILWYAAMTDPEITGLFGAMDTFAFGYGE